MAPTTRIQYIEPSSWPHCTLRAGHWKSRGRCLLHFGLPAAAAICTAICTLSQCPSILTALFCACSCRSYHALHVPVILTAWARPKTHTAPLHVLPRLRLSTLSPLSGRRPAMGTLQGQICTAHGRHTWKLSSRYSYEYSSATKLIKIKLLACPFTSQLSHHTLSLSWARRQLPVILVPVPP